jgi:hypothetical protein
MVHAASSTLTTRRCPSNVECFLDMPGTARTWLPPHEAAPTGRRMFAGILAPVGMVCAVAASAIASRMMVSCLPHFAPMFGGFAVLTPGM